MTMKNVAAGIGAGIIVGGTAAIIGSQRSKGMRMMKKKANKAMKTVEGIMGDMRYMFR